MPLRHIATPSQVPPAIAQGVDRLAAEVKLPGPFPPDVLAQASALAGAGPAHPGKRRDLTELDFCTLDPPGALDLDQAVYIEQDSAGFVVWYAIVDLAAWITPGSPIDVAARERGQTFYAPSWRIPLHPEAISEQAASLLPGAVARPANVWRIRLDSAGVTQDFEVTRGWVRSRAQLSYPQAQAELDSGRGSATLRALRELGPKLLDAEAARGGVSLNLPAQEIEPHGRHWRLHYAVPVPLEDWNAQISLLTGRLGAQLMIAAGCGVLRTLPPADAKDIAKLRLVARSLRLDWPADADYPQFIRTLDAHHPASVAMLNAATRLFRGAGYTVITPGRPQQLRHAALACEYAHVTAPLRRLVDRFSGEICVCQSGGEPIPDWVAEALEALPKIMAASGHQAKSFERGIVNLTEALVLAGQQNREFVGTVLEVDETGARGLVAVPQYAVEAPVFGTDLRLGAEVNVRLRSVSVATGSVEFEVADAGRIDVDESAG